MAKNSSVVGRENDHENRSPQESLEIIRRPIVFILQHRLGTTTKFEYERKGCLQNAGWRTWVVQITTSNMLPELYLYYTLFSHCNIHIYYLWHKSNNLEYIFTVILIYIKPRGTSSKSGKKRSVIIVSKLKNNKNKYNLYNFFLYRFYFLQNIYQPLTMSFNKYMWWDDTKYCYVY